MDLESDPSFHTGACPGPTFHFDADPDPTFQFDADPDPAPYQRYKDLRLLVYRPSTPTILVRLHLELLPYASIVSTANDADP